MNQFCNTEAEFYEMTEQEIHEHFYPAIWKSFLTALKNLFCGR